MTPYECLRTKEAAKTHEAKARMNRALWESAGFNYAKVQKMCGPERKFHDSIVTDGVFAHILRSGKEEESRGEASKRANKGNYPYLRDFLETRPELRLQMQTDQAMSFHCADPGAQALYTVASITNSDGVVLTEGQTLRDRNQHRVSGVEHGKEMLCIPLFISLY